MLGAKSQSDHPRWDSTQYRKALQKLERHWKPSKRRLVAQRRAYKVLVRENLKSLGHARRKLAALLDFLESFIGHLAFEQRSSQNVRGGNGVLDGEIDADSSDRRHGMGGVPDA